MCFSVVIAKEVKILSCPIEIKLLMKEIINTSGCSVALNSCGAHENY